MLGAARKHQHHQRHDIGQHLHQLRRDRTRLQTVLHALRQTEQQRTQMTTAIAMNPRPATMSRLKR